MSAHRLRSGGSDGGPPSRDPGLLAVAAWDMSRRARYTSAFAIGATVFRKPDSAIGGGGARQTLDRGMALA